MLLQLVELLQLDFDAVLLQESFVGVVVIDSSDIEIIALINNKKIIEREKREREEREKREKKIFKF
jgi:hypothetical protein